ncbi:MAG: radical SAM protein [Spirochaetales bacterium]|nr:radical SAM protein [Spirochaetales bacterium]
MKEWIRMERRLDWELTKKCNLKCTHCISPIYYPKVPRELSEVEAQRIVERCYEAGIGSVHFFGGEPTVRKDFLELLSLLDEMGIATSFSTNGSMWHQDKFVASLASLKHLQEVFFSFEDIRKEAQDSIRGKGSFYAACKGLRRVVTEFSGVTASVGFTLNRPAMAELHPRDIIDFFANIGADKLIFQDLAVPEGAPAPLKRLSYGPKSWLSFIYILFHPDFKGAIPFLYDIKPLVAEHLNRVIGSRLPIIYYGCNALSTEFRLLPNGVIIPCSAAISWSKQLDSYITQAPTLVEKPLDDILSLNIYRRFITHKKERGDPYMEPCRSCQYAYERCNPCIFGRLGKDVHKVQTCFWIKEVENGKTRFSDLPSCG